MQQFKIMYNVSEELAAITPSKKSRLKHAPTPNSKHKDRLIVQEASKRKQSSRKSMNIRILWFQFKGQTIKKMKKKMRKSNISPSINQQITENISNLLSQTTMKNEYIQILTKKITKSIELLAESKKLKQNNRIYFCEIKNAQRQLFSIIHQLEISNNQIQTSTDNIHFEGKRITFQMISQTNVLNLQIQQSQRIITMKQTQLNYKCQQFEKLTLEAAQMETKIQQLRMQLQRSTRKHKQTLRNYNIQMSQLFILKFQINSISYFGMSYNSTGIDKKLLLQKQYVNWERSKQKKIDSNDLKRWILIQLYRGWKNIIRKLSYQSSQYQILFGQIQSQPVLEDLKRFLSQDKLRASSKKWQKAIIFYSESKAQINRKQLIKNLLQKFNNNIIQIVAIDFNQFQGVTELEIKYIYLQSEEIIQKFIYQEYNIINKQKIVKDLKSMDRRTFCFIEIPLIAHKEDIIRYNQVYDIIRKSKNVR